MTAPYEWNGMPHILDVRCPHCGKKAYFEFSEIVRIREKKDVPFFQKSDQFEYRLMKDRCGHKWHAAIFHAGLHGRTVGSIRELPPDYMAEDWAHSEYLRANNGLDLGSIHCGFCHFRAVHTLKWPKDAYYQIDYKNETLWAFHEESARALRDFILAAHRDRSAFKWQNFLMHVPTVFLRHLARETVVRRLNGLLDPADKRARVNR